MQRYHGGSCTSAVNNSAFGGIQARDTPRAESPAVPPNFSLNPRRSSPLAPYKLRCDKEQLNPRLGPPDFQPPTPNCPEETLTREYVQSGYREAVEGLEDAREISLSQAPAFTKPVIVKCKEAIRKCHRAINESRAQKRKAGQVYGVPLSGSLLTKPGAFPDLRPCGEDFKKKWIEGLSQTHKRLCLLADHVPHGYRRKSLFEVLIRFNVPLLRATWFIKVTYLNQVRAASSNSSSSVNEATQLSRSELWTKDVIEYLQYLLDEFMAINVSHSNMPMRQRSSQMVYAGSMQQKSDLFSSVMDAGEPSLQTKWWYVVRIIQWHYAEGLLVPSLIIDWVFNQLQEKELFGVLQLLLPIIYGVIETVVLSQTYVCTLVGIAIRFIKEPSPSGSNLVDNSRRAYTTTALVEMLQYLMLAVPDTFVALDCFPLPACMLIHAINDGNFLSRMAKDARKVKDGQIEVTGVRRYNICDAQAESTSFLGIVSSINKRAETLSRAARPNHPGYNIAKASRVLDQALMHGDIGVAYKLLFENLWDGAWAESWLAQVSPCLYTSLKRISSVTSSLICSIFFICEWATCEFRDFRATPPHNVKFTGKSDMSQIFIAIRLLKRRMSDMPNPHHSKRWISRGFSDIYESPGPLHDIIVCWIDQHEVHNGEGFKRLQLLIRELIECGGFYPQGYVRQLIISGIMEANGTVVDLERRKRHRKLLKELPSSYIRDIVGKRFETPIIWEAMNIYSNERRLVLHGQLGLKKSIPQSNGSAKQKKHFSLAGGSDLPSNADMDAKLEELKDSISALLHLPTSLSRTDTGNDEAQGSTKRPSGMLTEGEASEETSGCEECKRMKRQKLSDERSLWPADEEEIWWASKGIKYLDPFKTEPPPRPAKQSLRGRQKSVRKTQTLAQLADARIEGSQGASTSHVCESRTGCPHHRTGFDEVSKSVDGSRKPPSVDILLIGKILKKMRFVNKRTVAAWLISTVKCHIEEAEKLAARGGGQFGRPVSPADNRSSLRWRLGEDELSAILYILDICDELVSASRFLLWLCPKLPSNTVSIIQNRNNLMNPRNAEHLACEVGEAFLLSCIRRYENVIVAADLIPETLSAAMHRAAAVLASNGRLSSLPTMGYARHLLGKYGSVASVIEWEKTSLSTCDKRLSSELECGRSSEGEVGFPFGVPNGVEDPDDYFRQKISSVRVSRVGLNMKETVNRHIDEISKYFFAKDKKTFGSGSNRSGNVDKWEDSHQIAKQIVIGLMDCMRQTGGAAQEGDPSLVSSAIAAVINNIGQVVAKIPDLALGTDHLNSSPPSGSLHFTRHILRIHITCLCILKEALGERQSRVFEVALATEASSFLLQAVTPGKGGRSQYQMSPETHDFSLNLPNETANKSAVLGRAARISCAVSALVVGSILKGVASLERMVSLFRLKEGLDLIPFARSLKSNVNGNTRSMGVLKLDNVIEVYLNWFRVLVGNCRTVCNGFIVDLLGEASIVALSRMQRTLSLNVVFPPAYSIFAFVVWKPILDACFGIREDFNQLYQLLVTSIADAIKHLPFREICLRDTYALYDIIAVDNLDSEFVSLLEYGSDINLKASAMVPLRSRLFLDSLVDCKMPQPMAEKNWVGGHGVLKKQCVENVRKLMGKLVHVLDTLQPARFHWQWVELRLLLNEQAINEKMENDTSLIEAIRSVAPNPDKSTASDSESNFIQIILTRLLVRPDAATLFSEVVHLLGKSLEDSMLSQAKWLLRGAEVLYGKKSIRQKILNIAAEFKELSLKPQHCKPWGLCPSDISLLANKGEKWKSEGGTLEEGEVVDEGEDSNPSGKGSGVLDVEGFIVSQQHVTERALVELIRPCLDQGSDDLRYNFASEMIKQISNIEQQINVVTCGVSKQAMAPSPGVGAPLNKNSNRKGSKSGSPGISRQSNGAVDTVPPSPAALRASMTLRLHFLIRLLPIICEDREPSGRNMRYALASVILRLLGSRVVHEDAGHFVNIPSFISPKRDVETLREPSASAELLCGESIFDCLLLVLHVLLSCHQPSWLKPKSESKATQPSKECTAFDREVAECMQNDLDRMELPEIIRWRIQTAMPIIFPNLKCFVPCQLPSVSPNALACLQPSTTVTKYNSTPPPPQRNLLGRSSSNLKNKPQPDADTEIIDQWTLLEDGTGICLPSTSSASISGGDNTNLKACSWLKGAVRVRRTDLAYIGVVDEDS